MKRLLLAVPILTCCHLADATPPQITIYNSGFALVRQSVPLELKAGENQIRFAEITSQIDPGSVILRDPAGKADFNILEQKFSSQPLSKERMLYQFANQTIPFRVADANGIKMVNGKIVRPPHAGMEAITEVDGHYLFELPGAPVFPALPDGAALRPELSWKISAKEAAKFDAELVFLTAGLGWDADYNAVTADDGNIGEFIGWITIKNAAGAHFDDARIKVVAGQVNRESARQVEAAPVAGYAAAEEAGPAPAQLRTLDDYREYVLPLPVTLRDGETAQTEFIRARNLKSKRYFVYDGSLYNPDNVRNNSAILDPQWGTQSSSTVVIMYEFQNDTAHNLGMPLPGGRIHFYRPDQDGQLQFAGDASIDNTAPNELVKASTGSAFDLVGERKQTAFQINEADHSVTETFQIKLRNHRKDKAEVRIREHPARWRQWEITAQSQQWKKIDQHTIEFVMPIASEEEKTLTYSVRYLRVPAPRRAPESEPVQN